MISKAYILSPNCIVVKGYLRCTLMDLQKGSLFIISKKLGNIISKPLKPNIFKKLNKDDFEIITKLINLDILLLVPHSQIRFLPKINSQFHNLSEINNCIIELNTFTLTYADKIIESLNCMNCKFLELRVSNEVTYEKLYQFLKKFATTTIESIIIYIEYLGNLYYKSLIKLKLNIPEVNSIYIYNISKELLKNFEKHKSPEIHLLEHKTINAKNCGNISPAYFSVNIKTYTEAINYNSCLNCKISINANGEIKQCPSISKTFGNISKNTLESVLKKREFHKFTNIKKDEIIVCKDCEFRYVCTDCRAYIENPNDIYSKPLKCGYDPYTCKWDEWSNNPLKQNAIKHYKLQDLIKDSKNKSVKPSNT